MRSSFVTIFGVFPAFSLCFFVLPGLIAAIGEYLEKGESGTLLIIGWCVLAAVGTFALFFSIERTPGPVGMVGLICGIAAMYGLDGFSYIGPSLWSLFFVGPVVVAIFLIIEGLSTNASEVDETDYWSN